MRDIKFRAWDKINKRFYKVETIYFEDGYVSLFTNTIHDKEEDLVKRKLSDVILIQYGEVDMDSIIYENHDLIS